VRVLVLVLVLMLVLGHEGLVVVRR